MENDEVLSDYDRTISAGKILITVEDMLFSIKGENLHEQEILKSAKQLIKSARQILSEGCVQ